MIHVKKELAIELKEVGYDELVTQAYSPKVGLNTCEPTNANASGKHTSTPTIDQVVLWLRNKHNLHCYSIPFVQDKFATWDRSVIDLLTGECLYNNGFHETHDEALAAAIERAVDIVKTKMEKI